MSMPQLAADLFAPVTIILMILGTVIALIPVMPGSLVVWLIAIAAAFIDGFTRITPTAMIIITLVMLISQLSDLWLPLLGVQTGGLSCAASLGSFVGGMIGTFVIPVPLLGTLIGCVVGALVVEYLQRRQLSPAMKAGEQAAKLFAIGYAIRLISSVMIVIVYVVSLVTMA
jgi:uncharacterized protein YqgC (DUF456 family)